MINHDALVTALKRRNIQSLLVFARLARQAADRSSGGPQVNFPVDASEDEEALLERLAAVPRHACLVMVPVQDQPAGLPWLVAVMAAAASRPDVQVVMPGHLWRPDTLELANLFCPVASDAGAVAC